MHVLDWVEDPDFADRFLELVQPIACTRDVDWRHLPKSHRDDREARLETFGPEAFPEDGQLFKDLKSWWLAHGGNTPNWDIAARANIEGTPGLILVEAKANRLELKTGSKQSFRLSKEQQARLSATEQEACRNRSAENDARIRDALKAAEQGLAATFPTITLSCDTDYQLSNRIAFAWWLANSGLPVVLLYLGFTGDETFGEGKFHDEADWQNELTSHLAAIGSPDILERRIDTKCAPMWVVARHKTVARNSPPAGRRIRTQRG